VSIATGSINSESASLSTPIAERMRPNPVPAFHATQDSESSKTHVSQASLQSNLTPTATNLATEYVPDARLAFTSILKDAASLPILRAKPSIQQTENAQAVLLVSRSGKEPVWWEVFNRRSPTATKLILHLENAKNVLLDTISTHRETAFRPTLIARFFVMENVFNVTQDTVLTIKIFVKKAMLLK